MNKKEKIVAIIQARMNSTRLPGKVLKEVEGIPLLKYQIKRIKKAKTLSSIVVATSTHIKDDAIETFCINNNIKSFRGSENDVLKRYYECAKYYNADVIVRLTADCPLVDPDTIDDMVNQYLKKGVDYASNTVPPETNTFPDGSDVEVFSIKALKRAHNEAFSSKDREHVTFYFWKCNHGFHTTQLKLKKNLSMYRYTVDYKEDFKVIAFVIKKLQEKQCFGNLGEIVTILDSNPVIRNSNKMYHFGIGWE